VPSGFRPCQQAPLITKHSKYELTDDFFDEFSNDGSDDYEEYDSEDTPGVVPALLWWFDACKENSQSSMEECKEISPSCKEFSCKEVASKNELENEQDHGNVDFEDQSGNGEDANSVDTTSAINRPVSSQAKWWDLPKDSDYLLWDRNENDDSTGGGNDESTTMKMGGTKATAIIAMITPGTLQVMAQAREETEMRTTKQVTAVMNP
jgi:hypothetical protein